MSPSTPNQHSARGKDSNTFPNDQNGYGQSNTPVKDKGDRKQDVYKLTIDLQRHSLTKNAHTIHGSPSPTPRKLTLKEVEDSRRVGALVIHAYHLAQSLRWTEQRESKKVPGRRRGAMSTVEERSCESSL